MRLQPGQILADKYRIVRQIGEGGMGAVYEGDNIRIHRKVAIKTLHASVAGKADVLQRFEREAQAAGRIGSEHIVEVLDMGDLPDGSRFMVMEFLAGKTLGDRILTNGKIPARTLVGPLTELLDGLGRAHEAGIIHRDLKPANIFLLNNKPGQPDFVKILDFGVSKFNILNSDEMSMTRTGAVMGTPYYMSPEQAKGARAIDTRSDLYSVGVIIYEALTGQVPFNAETFNELIFKIALEAPPPAESFVPNLDPAFAGIMRKAMAREPAERYQTADEMRAALLAWAAEFDAHAHAKAMGPALLGQGTMVMAPGTGGHPPQGGQHAGPHKLTGTVAMTSPARPAHQSTVAMPQGQLTAHRQSHPQLAPPAQLAQAKRAAPVALIVVGLIGIMAASGIGWFAYAQMNSSRDTPTNSEPSATTGDAAASVKTTSASASTASATVSDSATPPVTATAVATIDSPVIEVTAEPMPAKWTAPRPTATAPPTTTATAPKTSKPTRDITPDL